KEEIAESILTRNLHGIDIDRRAIQLAAAALWLKAKLYAPKATIARMNLVAPCFRLAALPKDDPALTKLYAEMATLGVPAETSRKLIESLSGVDHLGTLLHVDNAIAELVDDTGKQWGPMFAKTAAKKRGALEAALTQFLDAHGTQAELGIRLEGEQLKDGLRFVQLVKDGTYDIVVGNPPYQGLSKATNFEYIPKNYPRGKADLYASFLERGLQLCRADGLFATVTMQGWMFLGQFAELRQWILEQNRLRTLADLRWCAFELMRHATISMVVVSRGKGACGDAVALCPTPREEREESIPALAKKRAAVLAQVGRYEFDPKGFAVIEGEPIVYWWTKEFLEKYANAPKLGEVSPARFGLTTGDNERFVRFWHEIRSARPLGWEQELQDLRAQPWVPFVLGGKGRMWFEPYRDVCRWSGNGLEVKEKCVSQYGTVSKQIRNEDVYFRRGAAFAMIGATFSGRAHRHPSVIGNMGSSVYPLGDAIADTVVLMNRQASRFVLSSLNPGIHFEVGDVNRLPIFPVANSDEIFATIDAAFTEHESHREPSVEFKCPGPSPWRYAQDWAQRAVDRAEGEPLPPYHAEYDEPAPEADVSFAIGVALGRFGAHGEGILETAPATALPGGILFVGPSETLPDSLSHRACAPIVTAWDQQQKKICADKPQSVREWLHKDFFTYHKALYENRPIYFPLSSEKRSFVAFVSIHRWADNTLQTLLADHLNPALRKLEGEIADLKQARASSDKKTAATAEKQYATTSRLHDELKDFIAAVTECAERGAPPTDPKCPRRAANATFRMDLDDGVMVNSAALWPLLEPQWKDPKKWWRELCCAEGRKDYDWAHLARRYFPKRVEDKCVTDPSLAVAHGCFWKYHPAKAYAWELRLQDEIRPDFLIEEDDAGAARKRYLKEHKEEAKELVAKEKLRRERKALKADADDENPTEDVEERDDEAQPLKRLHTARPRPSSAKPLPLKKARERTSSERKSGSRLRAAAKRVG
ncbi:MAG TPA: BREX-6 system adenine-specific DNA-methyltransferase PglX, partial [Polyangiaceae bacterium]|nr:BREX-6 system adenine-specific DNA-methyltransferase PglX [Polyangiaceae bacterium]